MGIRPDRHVPGEYRAVAPITRAEAAAVAADPDARRIHVDQLELIRGRFWETLNDAVFSRRPDIYLSVGGFLTSRVDLSFAARVSHVRKFGLHGATEVAHVEQLAALPHLEQLYVNAVSLTSFDWLADVAPDLVELTLAQTRSKKPSLAPLLRFQNLRTLYLEGHHRGIEVVGELSALEDLTLRSITVADLSWLRPLKKLWSLDIKLGGTHDLSPLSGLKGLKYLELWQILGLDSVEIVAELPGLQNLFLQSLKRVTTLEPLARARKLRRLSLEDLSSVTSLAPLAVCHALQEFHLSDEKGQWHPEDLIPVLSNPALRAAGVSLWSRKKDARLDDLLRAHGKQRYEYTPFVYR